MRIYDMKGNRIHFYLILMAITIVPISIGCSENLTTDKAQKIILAAKKYPVKKIGNVEISLNSGQGVLITKDKMHNYIKMFANKLISMNIRGLGSDSSEYYDVELTDEGKKYVIKENTIDNKLVVDVLLGEVIFGNIVNIRKDPNGQGYNVKFLEEFSRITPFGSCLIDKTVFERTVHLALYERKWKIGNN